MVMIRLYEPTYPGTLLGREVLDENSRKIGVCTGIILNLQTKQLYILVTNDDVTLKIPISKIRLDGGSIIITEEQLLEDIAFQNSNLESVLKSIKEEVYLVACILANLCRSDISKETRRRETSKELSPMMLKLLKLLSV